MSETKPTKRSARRLTPEQSAIRLFDYIPTGESVGISRRALATAAGVTPKQVESGVAWLRENFPKDPLVSSSKEGYHWTYDPQQVGAFQRWRALNAQTTIMRLWRGVVKPYVEQRGVPGQMEFSSKQFDRLLEDIGALVNS